MEPLEQQAYGELEMSFLFFSHFNWPPLPTLAFWLYMCSPLSAHPSCTGPMTLKYQVDGSFWDPRLELAELARSEKISMEHPLGIGIWWSIIMIITLSLILGCIGRQNWHSGCWIVDIDQITVFPCVVIFYSSVHNMLIVHNTFFTEFIRVNLPGFKSLILGREEPTEGWRRVAREERGTRS